MDEITHKLTPQNSNFETMSISMSSILNLGNVKENASKIMHQTDKLQVQFSKDSKELLFPDKNSSIVINSDNGKEKFKVNFVNVDQVGQQTKTINKSEFKPSTIIPAVGDTNSQKMQKFVEASKAYICKICLKSFEDSVGYLAHMTTHTVKKKFNSDKCPASFHLEVLLSEHHDAHMKLYPCINCPEAFKDSLALNQHLKMHLTNWKENELHLLRPKSREYECKMCNIYFLKQSTLDRHLRTHQGLNPFQCGLCTATFKSIGGLKQHKNGHAGRKPLSIYLCSTIWFGKS